MRSIIAFVISCSLLSAQEKQNPYETTKWDSPYPGIIVEKQAGKWTITKSYADGFQVGDQIMSVDDVPIKPDVEDLNERLLTLEPMVIKVRRVETVGKRKKTTYPEMVLQCKTTLDAALSQFESAHDPLNEWTTYAAKMQRDPSAKTTLLPSVVLKKDGQVVFGITLIYIDSEWLFTRSLTIKKDDERITLEPTKVTRDVLKFTGRVMEVFTVVESGTRRVMELVTSDPPGSLFIRANGDDYYLDHILSEQERVAFSNARLLVALLEQKNRDKK